MAHYVKIYNSILALLFLTIITTQAQKSKQVERKPENVKSEIENIVSDYEKVTKVINSYFDKNIDYKDRLYNYIFLANRKDRNHKKDVKFVREHCDNLVEMTSPEKFYKYQDFRIQILKKLETLFDEYLKLQAQQYPELPKYNPEENLKNLRLQMLYNDYRLVSDWKSRIDKANINWFVLVDKANSIIKKFDEDKLTVEEWIANKPADELGKVAIDTRSKTEKLLTEFSLALSSSNTNLATIFEKSMAELETLGKFELTKGTYFKNTENRLNEELQQLDRYWKNKFNVAGMGTFVKNM